MTASTAAEPPASGVLAVPADYAVAPGDLVIAAPGGALSLIHGEGFGDLIRVSPHGAVDLVHDGRPSAVMRERIDALTRTMVAALGPMAEFPLEHLIGGGMYLRKLFIPRGTLLVGKIHLQACMNVVASGDISVLTEHGSIRVQAGAVALSGRGTQKVGFAHEDTVFVNVFRTDETDIARIEAMVAGESHVDPLAVETKESLCH